MVSAAHTAEFQSEGYTVVKGLFSKAEVDGFIDHFMEIRKNPTPGDDTGFAGKGETDPLKLFPRIIHPHRWDEKSFEWLLDPRLRDTLTALLGAEPIAGQTMVYFKPAGSRGQALHQDQLYLRVSPGTCVAAWMALDRCDEENGCLQVVPGTQNFPVVCTTAADTNLSFTDVTTPLPPGFAAIPVIMEPGDVLFFNGSLVHGSGPNTSQDRFRRSLIGHYLTADAKEVAHYYNPAYHFDGSLAEVGAADGGGPCGVWVDREGSAGFVLTDQATATPMAIH